MEEKRLGAWDCRYCGTKKILGNIFECPRCGHPRHKGVRFYQIPDGPIVTKEIQKQLGSGNPNWYCEHCGCGNRDIETLCIDCGAPKGSSPSHEVKIYRNVNAPKSTKEAEILDPDGKSWIENKAESQYAHLTSTEELQEIEFYDHSWDEEEPKEDYVLQPTIVSSDEDGNITSKLFTSMFNRYFPQKKIPLNFKKYGLIALSILLSLSLVFLGYQIFFNTHKESVTIAKYSWEQKIILEKYSAERESSWSSHPPQAYDIDVVSKDTGQDIMIHDGWITVSYIGTCSQSVYNSRTCSQTVDNGDGSFSTDTYECGSYDTQYYSCTQTRQEEIFHYEDIWDNYYTYTIDKWVFVNEFPTSGSDKSPFYAYIDVPNLFLTGTPVLEQQRIIEVPGTYKILFKCENKKINKDGYFEKEYPLEEWLLFSEKEEYTIKVNSFNQILENPKP